MSDSTLSRLLDDQASRWARGEALPVEAYLRRHPELASDREALLDLIYNEIVLRTRRGEQPTLQEYAARFPDLTEQLRAQFEVHAALATASLSAEETPGSAGNAAGPGELAPGATLGRHVLLEKLGEGGMGAVWRARHTALDRIDAVKVIRAQLLADAGVRSRFYQEARAAARLNHPNVVAVHDAGEDRGRHYLVLEFVEGTDLAGVLREQGRLAWEEVAALLYQVALGLQHVHECGLVHRDLKPSNLLRTRATGQIKILDLGLACLHAGAPAEADRPTAHGQILGTPDYMAPEQASGPRTVDIRADLYSLGCTAYHLLAGRVPFPAGDLFDKILRHRRHEPPPLGSLRPDAPAALLACVARLMAKEPADRYQTPADLARALHPLLPGPDAATAETVAASGSGPAPRPSRRRLLLGVAGGALAAVGLAVYYATGRGFFSRPPASSPPPAVDLDLRIWKAGRHHEKGQRLWSPGAAPLLPLRPGDAVRLEAEAERPAYLYLVWLQADGTLLPGPPWEGEDWTRRPPREEPRTVLTVPPGAAEGFTLEGTATGVEAFLLLARDEPLPPDLDLRPWLSAWQPRPDAGDLQLAAWLVDGRDDADPLRTGRFTARVAVADPVGQVRHLMRTLQEQVGGSTRAVCFGYSGK